MWKLLAFEYVKISVDNKFRKIKSMLYVLEHLQSKKASSYSI